MKISPPSLEPNECLFQEINLIKFKINSKSKGFFVSRSRRVALFDRLVAAQI